MFILCHPPGRGIISPPSSRLGIVVIMFKLMGYLYSPNLEWESSASFSENLTPAERELVKMPLPGIRLVGYRYWSASRLRELGMDNIGVLMPIVDAHPHLAECAQTGQNTTADPCRILALWWRKDLDPHVLDSQLLHF